MNDKIYLMIYRNIYFKECNHVKIKFEKNAEFNP